MRRLVCLIGVGREVSSHLLTPAQRPLPLNVELFEYQPEEEWLYRYSRPLLVVCIALFVGLYVGAEVPPRQILPVTFGLFVACLIVAALVSYTFGLRWFAVRPGPSPEQEDANTWFRGFAEAAPLANLPPTTALRAVGLAPGGARFLLLQGRGDLLAASDTVVAVAQALGVPRLEVWAADALSAVYRVPPVLTGDAAKVAAVFAAAGLPEPDEIVPRSGSLRSGDATFQLSGAFSEGLLAGSAELLAAGLAVREVTVSAEPHQGVTLFTLTCRSSTLSDPLAVGRSLRPAGSAGQPLVVGRTSEGADFALDLLGNPYHLALQGQTRSGKSVALYAILAQSVPSVQAGHVVIGGCDPPGLLLAPWSDYAGAEFRATGTGDLEAHVAALEAAVAEMDRRIAQMLSDGVDKLTPSAATPALFFVLEEFPGLLAALRSADAALKPAERRLPRVKAAVQRLQMEGAKAAIRVLEVAQRFDAEIIGGAERSNIACRVTLRVDNGDAVRMLHPSATPEQIEQITRFESGYAFVDLPAQPGQVVRFDYVTYADYRKQVLAGAPIERPTALEP